MNPLVTPIFMGVVAACFAVLWWVRRQHNAERAAWRESLGSAQADLRLRMQRHRAVLEAIPSAVVLCDEAGMVRVANRAACDLFAAGDPLYGRDFEEILTDGPSEVAQRAEPRTDLEIPGYTLYMVDR